MQDYNSKIIYIKYYTLIPYILYYTLILNSTNHRLKAYAATHTLSGRIGWLPRMMKLQYRLPVEPRLHRFILCTRRSGGTAHDGGGATSQLDLPSLTILSVAGCGRLQLGVPN